MKAKFFNWKDVCVWAYKECEECNSSIRESALKCLEEVEWNQPVMIRSKTLRKAWFGFCDMWNIQSKLKDESKYLSMLHKEEISNFFVKKALESEEIVLKPNEQLIDDKITFHQNVVSTNQPILKCTQQSMLEVEDYFLASNSIDLQSLLLCHKILKHSTKFETLAFLKDVYENLTDKYYDLPTEKLSKMNGRPCKTRDLIEIDNCKAASKKMLLSPSVIITTSDNFKEGYTKLFSKSNKLVDTIDGGGLCAVVPTNSTLEQFIITCDIYTGSCRLFTSTRKDLELLGNFDIEKPSGKNIDWIDCIVSKGKILFYWGGSDCLRGQVTWMHYSGINIEQLFSNDGDLFYDAGEDVYGSVLEIVKEGNQDFGKHGNVLTLWTQTVEDETEQGRKWVVKQQINIDKSILKYSKVKNCACVWGTHMQFLSFGEDGIISVVEHGKLKQEFDLETKIFSGAALYAHSK